MTKEKPIHVQVAEALGCKPEKGVGRNPLWLCACRKADYVFPHGDDIAGTDYTCSSVRRYDLDWAATGLLVERFRIQLSTGTSQGKMYYMAALNDDFGFDADPVPDYAGEAGYADTYLLAICNLILALHEAGKLKGAA